MPPGPFFKGFILALAVTVATIGSLSASENKCRLRAGNYNLPPGRLFAGMFEVRLRAPDFRDPIASQRHLAFAMIWGYALSSELNKATGGKCGAYFTPYAFPNVRAFLMAVQSDRFDEVKIACQRALDDVLQHPQANERTIRQAVSVAVLGMEPAKPSGRSVSAAILDASNIMHLAYRQIYESNSLLHVLASVPWREYRSIPTQEYQEWVQSQASSNQLRSEPIPQCLSSPQQRGWVSDSAADALRDISGILPPGEITLKRGDGPVPLGPLHYSVMVSDVEGAAGSTASSQLLKYCDREHSFPFAGLR